MTEQASTAPERDDRRGTPPGRGTIVPAHGGRIGNPPFVPTEAQRMKVRQLAKAFPVNGEHHIARLCGFSKQTLRRHFLDDLELGRAEMLAALGAQMVNRALDAEKADEHGQKLAKGDLDAQKFVLARLGGWSTKVEHAGPDGGAIPIRTFDLSHLTADQKAALLPVIDQLLAQAPAIDAEFSEVPPEDSDDASA